ncbi:uncharacterized protein LOC135506189 isoform X4 [Oncorhynchus masou masou]|uniref:uncharacterized protein LOC135506189 isoform X4 n=1 Tax=Oncorhynchus masou masou TaxID=90313 RepID=UPI003183F77A
MFVHMDVKKPLIFIVCLLYYVATCVLGNPDAACRFRTARVSNRGDETVSCFEPRGSNDPVCRTGLKSSEGCCVYITNDQAWLKWDEKITLRCDSTHYGNSDGECASNQSSLDCDGEISANTTPGTDTPGTDTPGQQNTTQNGTPTARPRGRLFLLLPVSMAAVILLGTASYKHWKKLDSMSCCCP